MGLLGRVTNQSETVGTAASVTTRYTFVGLANQIAIEQEQDTAGTWKTSKSYAYGANGENLSVVDSPVNGTTSKKSFYGTNPHGDVETLTDASTGTTTSTYRYTAYGQPDRVGTTGDDKITGTATDDADIVNPYRFNSARFDGATGTYDMGMLVTPLRCGVAGRLRGVRVHVEESEREPGGHLDTRLVPGRRPRSSAVSEETSSSGVAPSKPLPG